MAFSGMGSNGGRGDAAGGGHRSESSSEMNVVPLVDVVLVLLIIFMVTASVMEFGLKVDVPQVKQVKDTTEEHPVITVARNGTTYLNDKPVNLQQVGKEVKRKFPGSGRRVRAGRQEPDLGQPGASDQRGRRGRAEADAGHEAGGSSEVTCRPHRHPRSARVAARTLYRSPDAARGGDRRAGGVYMDRRGIANPLGIRMREARRSEFRR